METDTEAQRKRSTSSQATPVASPTSESTMKSPVEGRKFPGHDSMVTVRLSEPPSLSVNTDLPPTTLPSRRSIFGPECTPTSAVATPARETESIIEEEEEECESPKTLNAKTPSNLAEELRDSVSSSSSDDQDQSSDDDMDDSDTEEVNWEKLQKTEDEEVRDQDDNDNSTAMLLARLEQENNKLATNPKSVKVKVVEQPATRRPRPPSMAQLREMVHGPTPTALRYSVLPPPPMTDLEFYMALVKDYQQTAARLPTLLSKKIRKGVPPPLRGVVWQSMAGARDTLLLEQFERLSGETSPYEGLIGKDLGRSFPGVDMFRDPEGDGQRMLGRVLKCFSLYDQKIGYCQGLAFLVGPLLMHMPDNQAFCVLVRLMERYDLRSCFLPDLSGLHVRIYQFRELLRSNLATVSNHLDDLQVDPAYVSQWFLSFFAVTCPLPMLFRIYDVIFAEGASETIMRVALSLMRKNESRILACTELEDVMQLLLSRGLWDCYHYNADEFVDDFVGLSCVVTREKLAQLEQAYREEKVATANAARASDITTAASRFLGRLWASSTISKSGALSPGLNAPSRPLSMLRRSPSKQSLASTLNSMEASSVSVLSSASTDATSVSRDSSNVDVSSIRESTPTAPKVQIIQKASDKNLHDQIEDLLMALSELQRNHALLATQLQQEREERDEDRKAVKSLLDGLKQKANNAPGAAPDDTKPTAESETEDSQDDAETPASPPAENRLSQLISAVEDRFDPSKEHDRNSAQTKAQLQDELTRTKDRLVIEVSKTRDFNQRIDDLGQEANTLRDQLRESHAHVRNLHQEKQRLERQVHSMRVRASSEAPPPVPDAGSWWSSTASLSSAMTGSNGTTNSGAGLRELKLGRSKSTPSTQAPFLKQPSSLMRTQTEPIQPSHSAAEQDALVLELVQAKTAEAVARQEADEFKQKLEQLRKAVGLAPGETPAAAAKGVLGRLTNSLTEANIGAGGAKNTAAPAGPTSAPSAPSSTTSSGSGGGGGFWGWRR